MGYCITREEENKSCQKFKKRDYFGDKKPYIEGFDIYIYTIKTIAIEMSTKSIGWKTTNVQQSRSYTTSWLVVTMTDE